MGVRRGVWIAGDSTAAEPDACEKEEDLSLSVGTVDLVLSLIFGVVVFGLEALFSAAAAAARVEAEVLILSLTIAIDWGGRGGGAGRRDVVVVDIEISHQPQLSSSDCGYPAPLANPCLCPTIWSEPRFLRAKKTILPTLLAAGRSSEWSENQASTQF